jgi:hypothetical protein
MSPKLPGKAAYSSEKELVFLQNYSDAGFHAGVFLFWLAVRRRTNWLKCCIDEEMQQFRSCRIH